MILIRRDNPKLDAIPQWKRELLYRKRIARFTNTYARTSFCNFASSDQMCGSKQRYPRTANKRSLDRCRQPDFHLQHALDAATTTNCVSDAVHVHATISSVDNMKLLDEVCARDSIVVKSRTRFNAPRTDRIRQNYLKHVIEMNEGKCRPERLRYAAAKCSPRSKIRSLSPPVQPPDDDLSDSSEELRYGPGIVNKLKTKYMSMTLRDNQKKYGRPSLSNLRKASSLDNLLDDDILDANNTYQISSVVSCCVNKFEYSSRESSSAGCVTVNFCADLKRARSMETLQESPTELRSHKPYENGQTPLESVACDEKRREDKELPPPDLVKETLKIFENCHQNSNGSSWKCSNEVKSPKKNVPSCGKPVLYPKPVIVSSVESKKVVKSAPVLENGVDERKVNGVESPTRCSLASIKVNFESKIESPRTNTTAHFTTTNVSLKTAQILAPSPEKVLLNGDTKKPPLRENGLDKSCRDESKPRSDILKPLDTLPVRQVGIIRPLVSSKSTSATVVSATTTMLTPQEIEKNYINAQKNLDSEKLNGEKECEKFASPNKEEVIGVSPPNGVNKPSTLWCKKPWNQQQNTMVFNFRDRKDVPDYIENDGLLLTPNRDRAKVSEIFCFSFYIAVWEK